MAISSRRKYRPETTTYLRTEDVYAEHVRDELKRGAGDENDIFSHAREQDLIIVTSDVTDFGSLPSDTHAGIVLLYDDTMPAYRVAPALLAMIDAYRSRVEFGGREELDPWSRGARRSSLPTKTDDRISRVVSVHPDHTAVGSFFCPRRVRGSPHPGCFEHYHGDE